MTPPPSAGPPSSTPTPSPTVPAVAARIREVQGRAHRSPLHGTPVTGVAGVVTARRRERLLHAGPPAGRRRRTSEGIFVFTAAAPTVAIGDAVQRGRHRERVPSRLRAHLPALGQRLQQPDHDRDRRAVGAGVVPQATPCRPRWSLGAGGRSRRRDIETTPPATSRAAALFDPANDGIDFYESLEGMRVQVNDAVASGPPAPPTRARSRPGGRGDAAGQRTTRGGVVVPAGDFNPERIILDDLHLPVHRGERRRPLPGGDDRGDRLLLRQLQAAVSIP